MLEKVNPRLGVVTSRRIADAVLRCQREQGLDPPLVLRVLLVESSARPDAHSPKGAVGVMQVMPYMYSELGLPGGAAHLETNIEAGCLLLADNIRRLGEADGISAYFWGRRIQGQGYLRRVRSILESLEADGSGQQRG
ncbi:MAG: transglycosylase SLT domain-containing protein [Myxococcota bacterium]